MKQTRRTILGGAAAWAALAGVARAAPALGVVASFSILADIVRNVAGSRAAVTPLVGPNGDAHVYTPTAGDARTLAAAGLVVVNGLGFEGWLDRLVKASGTRAPVVTASDGVAPRQRTAAGHNHGGPVDPHAWQSVGNVRIYARNIRDALAARDPAGRNDYFAQAEAYDRTLTALDAEIRDLLAAIPAERRRIVTTHAAFGYFAEVYGVSFFAPQGVSTEAEASAGALGRLVSQIRDNRIPAVFLENVTDPRLLERITKETGAKIGGTLYSDALTTPDGPAPTYIALMRHNVRQIVGALGS